MKKFMVHLKGFLLTVVAFIVDRMPKSLVFGMGVDTTTTTLTEAIPTIVASALLELEEGNVVAPLITQIQFPGPGLIHQTPFIRKLKAETDTDAPTAQALDSGTSDETSPSAATVSVQCAYVQLKDLAALASVDDMAAIAGQLIGQSLVTRRDLDLVTLFASFTTNQGGANTSRLAPADLYDAYGSLRRYFAPLPYHLVLNPVQIWSSIGLISLFDNSTDAIQTMGPGTVGEDFARYGFAGMALGFNLWSDANVAVSATVYNGSGAAFSRQALKQVMKRGLVIEVERDSAAIADKIVGSEIRGEAVLRNLHGNEMQFDGA